MATFIDERGWERRQLKGKMFEFDMNEGRCSGTGGNTCVCVVMIDLKKKKKKEE